LERMCRTGIWSFASRCMRYKVYDWRSFMSSLHHLEPQIFEMVMKLLLIHVKKNI
jgi:hypothetical protein